MEAIIESYFKFFDNLSIHYKISIQILSLILFTFFASKLIKYALFTIFKYFSKNNNAIDNSTVVAAKKPILFFMWLYCFVTCSNLAIERLDEKMIKVANTVEYIIIYLAVLVFLLKSISQIKRHYVMQKQKYSASPDYAGIDAIEKLSKFLVVSFVGIVELVRCELFPTVCRATSPDRIFASLTGKFRINNRLVPLDR